MHSAAGKMQKICQIAERSSNGTLALTPRLSEPEHQPQAGRFFENPLKTS
jgi:hypothetical protein